MFGVEKDSVWVGLTSLAKTRRCLKDGCWGGLVLSEQANSALSHLLELPC